MNLSRPHLTPPSLRWISVICWTALVLITLLQSSQHPVLGPPAPLGPPPLEREIMLTLGHMVAFSILTAAWWWALCTLGSASVALLLALTIAISIGVITELAQTHVADRSASLLDMLVNIGVAVGTALIIQWRAADSSKPSRQEIRGNQTM